MREHQDKNILRQNRKGRNHDIYHRHSMSGQQDKQDGPFQDIVKYHERKEQDKGKRCKQVKDKLDHLLGIH